MRVARTPLLLFLPRRSHPGSTKSSVVEALGFAGDRTTRRPRE